MRTNQRSLKIKEIMKAKSAKAKGRRLQQWVANKIADLLDIPTGKDLDIESRPMGQSGVDVILRGKALKLFPFSVECKNTEKFSIPKWIKQAQKNKLSNTDWILFCKRNHMDPIVVLNAEVFFNIMRRVINDRTS